jgi:CheY-like chemotaxis protein
MSPGGSKAHRRILIVDDDPEAREILAIALRTIAGAAVETNASAEEALRSAAAARVDVLLTDVIMSTMTGLELLAALRERGCWPACGVLVISGETDPDLPRRALAAGANTFFAKPLSVGAVRRSVISLLAGSHGSS